jgi:NAD(P)H-dependent FMN reductase
MPRIIAFAGSYRANSYNKRVLAIAVNGAREAGGDVTVIDLNEFPMPVYNADDQGAYGFDPNALRLQDVLAAHEGLLIASPEYNGSIPGGLKNTVDWTSRKSEQYGMNEVFRGKTAALITASPGAFGGLRCLAHLRGVLTIMGAWVMPAEIAVPFVSQKFDGDGAEMTDEKTRSTLHGHGAALVSALAS